MAIKGDEILVYQRIPRIYIIVRVDGQQDADFIKNYNTKARTDPPLAPETDTG